MTIVWAMLGNAFYLALVLDGWVRVDNYVGGHVWWKWLERIQ
jgi:hypothetical protein